LINQKNNVPPHPKGCGLLSALVFWMHEKNFMVFSAQKITLKEFSCARELKTVPLATTHILKNEVFNSRHKYNP